MLGMYPAAWMGLYEPVHNGSTVVKGEYAPVLCDCKGGLDDKCDGD